MKRSSASSPTPRAAEDPGDGRPIGDEEAFFEPLLRRLRLRRIRRHIPVDARVVDFGCGFRADVIRALSKRIAEGVGVDLKVAAREAGNIRTLRRDFTDVPELESGWAGVALVLAVIEHLSDPAPLLHEVYRVLRPGGTLLLTVPTPRAKPVLKFLAFRLGVVSRTEIEDHKIYYSRSRLLETLEQAGFRDCIYRRFQLGLNSFVRATRP